ncbi:hypothetical protein ABT218_23815 [Streptomyces sp. NPDC001455]|uniref:hypothetical protein n=1 Tax=Streptomyces sp. NPDC001455 TaxID=3154518 RepID=UPI0033225C2A
MAVKAVWEALCPLGLGLREAEQVVHARYEVLGGRVQHRPPDPLDIPSLASRAAVLPGQVGAVEALWDGDTVNDWFVVLDDPAGEGRLATDYHSPGGPPPGTAAAEAGQALAYSLGVPFHFASPDVPDVETPRWRTVWCLPEGS